MNLQAIEFLGALSSAARAAARPMADVHAHLDDILKSYPDAAAFAGNNRDMITWAFNWVQKDAAQLAEAGEPRPDAAAWRERLHAAISDSDLLMPFSAWRTLLANPKVVPTAAEIAKAPDAATRDAVQTRLWAAAQLVNPLQFAAVYEFDRLTRDLRGDAPGVYGQHFLTPAGKALMTRIDKAMKGKLDYGRAGDAVWTAMRQHQAEWSAADKAKPQPAPSALVGAQPYGAASGGRVVSATSGKVPSVVAVRTSGATANTSPAAESDIRAALATFPASGRVAYEKLVLWAEGKGVSRADIDLLVLHPRVQFELQQDNAGQGRDLIDALRRAQYNVELPPGSKVSEAIDSTNTPEGQLHFMLEVNG